MNKPLPIGVDDFKKIITENYYYIDKTTFIKEILESKAEATLIPRPRRFGKTLNMSTLRYFFEKSDIDHTYLFNDLAITHHKESMMHQGQYPVIFLTLKFVDTELWQDCFDKMRRIIATEYQRHLYLVESIHLTVTQKKEFEEIIALTATKSAYEVSLKNLIAYLSKYHQKRTIVLIDEYDVPMHSGYRHNYFEQVSQFIKSFFGDAFKGNEYLEFAVITGVLRVAKESIFSGLNNLEVCTVLSSLYADKFGLLENEITKIIHDYNLKNHIDDVRAWYNGYRSGPYTLYNPWSIINLIKNKGTIQPYWINTSSNDIVKKLIKNSSDGTKENIEVLISGGSITKPLSENIVYGEIEINDNALWNFLLFSGYLTFHNKHIIGDVPHVDLMIPNREVNYIYVTTILSWFNTHPGEKIYNQLLQSLIDGDIETFKQLFDYTIQNSFSYYDLSGKKPENFYHAFVLGMLVSLADRYEIKSNKESGFGRYDVMIIPRDITKYGIIIEFKKVSTYTKEMLEEAAENAVAQIEKKKYAQELEARGIKKIIKLGIAFEGKQTYIRVG